MNTISILANRNTISNIPEVYYIQDNKISSIRIQLPPKIGDYNREECSIELRAVLPSGDYISYTIPNDSKSYDWQPTIDITEKTQIVNLVFVVTANGGVIGRTKPVQLNIQVNPDKGEELTPREQFDIVINEQRETIQEQEQTITEQSAQIEQDSETISGLNTQVSDLTTENEQLETQHTADQNTIQYLIENPPEARLQPKSVTPTATMQVVEPDEGYQGLSTVTVGAVTPPRLQGKAVNPSFAMQNVQPDSGYDGLANVAVGGVTAEIDSNIQPENIKEGVEILGVEGTYDPFPYNSVGGIYITEVNEDGYPVKILVKNYFAIPVFPQIIVANVPALIRSLKYFIFEDCPNITTINPMFDGFTYIKEICLPENLTAFPYRMCMNCSFLEKINIPASVTSISSNVFVNCTSLINVTIENGFNCNNLNLSSSTLYSVETIVSWLNALADRTGLTAYTLTIGTPNREKLTNEQKAIATNKNWNLA